MSTQHRDPSEVQPGRGWFDEFAERAHYFVSRDFFFIGLGVLTLLWLPTYFLFDSVSDWYLVFVLPAESVTLFLVALLENSNRRSEKALQRKLNAFALALAAMADDSDSEEVRKHAAELLAAVGLEDRESTGG